MTATPDRRDYFVYAAYHQIFLAPLEVSPLVDRDDGRALVHVMEDNRSLVLITGCADGPVSVTVEHHAQQPPDAAPPGEVIEAASILVSEPLNLWGPTAEDGGAWLVFEPVTPGPHRVRVSGVGRLTSVDHSVLEPVEHYVIQVWPDSELHPSELLVDDGYR